MKERMHISGRWLRGRQGLTGLLLWFFLSFSAAQGAGFESPQALLQWMQAYYRQPQPQRLVEAAQYMSAKKFMRQDSQEAALTSGFLSGIFREHPELVPGWLHSLATLKESDLATVLLAIWHASLPNSAQLVSQQIDRYPALTTRIGYLRSRTPIPIEEVPLDKGVHVIGMLWGKYWATGEFHLVERIVSTLAWINSGDTRLHEIGQEAAGSLITNALRDERILEIGKQAARNQGGATAIRLAEIEELVRRHLHAQQEREAERAGMATATRYLKLVPGQVGDTYILRVVDEKTTAPVANAKLILDWDMETQPETYYTDQAGRVSARGTSMYGMFEIRVSAEGYFDERVGLPMCKGCWKNKGGCAGVSNEEMCITLTPRSR